jgi:hypothetical protein
LPFKMLLRYRYPLSVSVRFVELFVMAGDFYAVPRVGKNLPTLMWIIVWNMVDVNGGV